jgi:hypothetical protein
MAKEKSMRKLICANCSEEVDMAVNRHYGLCAKCGSSKVTQCVYDDQSKLIKTCSWHTAITLEAFDTDKGHGPRTFMNAVMSEGVLTGSRRFGDTMQISSECDMDILMLFKDFDHICRLNLKEEYHVSSNPNLDARYSKNTRSMYIHLPQQPVINIIVCLDLATYKEWGIATDICTALHKICGATVLKEKSKRVEFFEYCKAMASTIMKIKNVKGQDK